MAYTVRDVNGTMTMKITNAVALDIIDNFSGFFKEAKYTDSTKIVYVLNDDYSVKIMENKIFLWKGTRLIPD